MPPKKGFFITLEGIEGVGKSTNLEFLRKSLATLNINFIVTREPGGTKIAEAIRQILLATDNEQMTYETELLLMFAARAQHIAQVIAPALAKQQWVLCDRFTDASYAYQGSGRGIAFEKIAFLENWIQGELRPDLILILDAPVDVALKRTKKRAGSPDRIEAEKKDFFQKARQGYLLRAKEHPEHYRIIDAAAPKATVQQQIYHVIQEFIHAAA